MMLYYISSSLKSCQINLLKSFESHVRDIWINVLMKLVENLHATQSTITCLKSTMEDPEQWVRTIQSLDPHLEPSRKILSFSPLC